MGKVIYFSLVSVFGFSAIGFGQVSDSPILPSKRTTALQQTLENDFTPSDLGIELQEPIYYDEGGRVLAGWPAYGKQTVLGIEIDYAPMLFFRSPILFYNNGQVMRVRSRRYIEENRRFLPPDHLLPVYNGAPIRIIEAAFAFNKNGVLRFVLIRNATGVPSFQYFYSVRFDFEGELRFRREELPSHDILKAFNMNVSAHSKDSVLKARHALVEFLERDI